MPETYEGGEWGEESTRAESSPSPRHRPPGCRGVGLNRSKEQHRSSWTAASPRASEAKRSLKRRRSRSRAPERSPVRLRLPETMLVRNSPDDGSASRPRVLFLMGLPGGGKSTVKRQLLRPDDVDIEPDKIKRRHHGFCEDMGEETDEEVHRWSVRRSVDEFEDSVRSALRPNLVFDSSGSNASWLRHRIDLAKRRGYFVELLWVDVPVEIALLRNRNRGFEKNRRGQFCPEKIILDKAKVLESSFEELSKIVHVAERMQNWSEDSHELEEAKEDIYLYPAPRNTPPALRPHMKHYGEAPDGARAPSPSAGSRRKLRIGPWKRNEEVTKRKDARLAWMDRVYRGDRESYVFKHVLGSREVLLERNKFPYQLPPGAEHWTIWARKDMDHKELCEYVEAWLDAREPHNVVSWNYDDNWARRTINIFHVHVYFQGRGGRAPNLLCPSTEEEMEAMVPSPGKRRRWSERRSRHERSERRTGRRHDERLERLEHGGPHRPLATEPRNEPTAGPSSSARAKSSTYWSPSLTRSPCGA